MPSYFNAVTGGANMAKLAKLAQADGANKISEEYTYKMVNTSAEKAPVLDGFLRSSITASPHKIDEHTWGWGSDMPYATRQEFEHASRSGFIRNTINEAKPEYIAALKAHYARGGE